MNIEGFDHHTNGWNAVYTGGSQRADLWVDGGYVKIQHDFGAVSLTSITAYDRTHAWYEEDNTANGNRIGGVNHDVLIIDMDQEFKQFTQELRLASDDDKARFRWIAGLYYLQEDALLAQNVRFGSNGFPGAHPSAVGITPPSLFDVIPNPYANTVSFSISDLEDQSMSAYGHTDYEITDKLTLTVGLRYTRDDKANPSYYAGAFDKTGRDPASLLRPCSRRATGRGPAGVHSEVEPCLYSVRSCARREHLPTGSGNGSGGRHRIGLRYRVTDDFMLYGGYSRGFKSGKFDMEFLHTDDTPFPQRPLDPEILNTFELGFKSTTGDALLLNAAVFYNIWKDQQVFNVGVNGPEFFNLPESKIYGAEVELEWALGRDWLLTGSLGYLHTEITDVTGIDFDLRQGDFQKGHELPLAPEMTGNAGVQRTFEFSSSSLVLRADYRYQSSSKVKYSPQVPIDEYDSRAE